MSTSEAVLNVDAYVRVNLGYNPITLQAHRDLVRIVFTADKPAKTNTAFHALTSDGPPLQMVSNDTNVWALATTEHSSLIVTETVSHQPSKGAFGEAIVSQVTPVVQMSAQYGLLDKTFLVEENGGTAVAEDSLFKAVTGAAGSTAAVLSSRQLSYRPGQGAICRLTATFTAGVAGSEQIAGLITATDAFGFGYDGDTFGVLHAHDGHVDIRELTVTTGAGGAENASVTIDDVVYTVPLVSGSTQNTAAQIAASLSTQLTTFDFYANDSVILCVSVFADTTGTFAFSSATAVATWATVRAGVDSINDWIPQADWNGNLALGLDPTLGNVYQIQFQYLGFGGIRFYREDPDTTDFVLVHTIPYANTALIPSVTNPTFRCGWATSNFANTSELTVAGGSVAGSIEGPVVILETARGLSSSIASLGTSQTNLLTVRNRAVLGHKRNRAETIPLVVSAFTESNKGAFLVVRKNAEFAVGDLSYDYVDKDTSTTEYATDPVVINTASGIVVAVIPVTLGAGGGEIDFKKLGEVLLPGDTLSMSMATISGGAADAGLTYTFQEDI